MKQQIKVTFQATYQVKEKRKLVEKTSQIVEMMNADADYKLRALALGWTVLKVEQVQQ